MIHILILLWIVDDLVKAAAAWTLGQIGGHSADHARAMAEADVPSHLLAVNYQISSFLYRNFRCII